MMQGVPGWSEVQNGFWGSDYSVSSAETGQSIIAARMAQQEQLIQARVDGHLAQEYFNHGNYEAAIRILNGNSDVGLYAGGVDLWGDLAVEYAKAASKPVEVAQLIGDPIGINLQAVQRGLRAVAALVQKARKPDFYILTAAYGVQGSLAVTRSCTFTVSLGGSGGKMASLMMGWILTLSKPSDEAVVNFLTGPTWGGDIYWNPRTGLGAGVGAGFIHSPNTNGRRWAVTVGGGVGGGFSGNTGWKLLDWDTLQRYASYVPIRP